jgi:hypothetical protein
MYQTPAVPPDRHPDAVMVPKPFQRLVQPAPFFNRLFLHSGVLGPQARKIHVFVLNHERPAQYFIAPDPDATRNFGTAHVLASTPRYDWYVVGETDTSPLGMPRPTPGDVAEPQTVRFGWLRDADALTPPSLDEKVAHERLYGDYMRDLLPQIARYRELLTSPTPLSDAGKAELAALEAKFQA